MKTLNTLIAIAAVASAVLAQHAHASSAVSTPSKAKLVVESSLHLPHAEENQHMAGSTCINLVTSQVNRCDRVAW